MKLEFVLVLLVFGLFLGRQPIDISEVERAFLVDTLVDVEVLTVFLLDKNMAAVWADKSTNFEIGLVFVEPGFADLANQLTASTGVVVNIFMRCAATMAHNIFRNGVATTRFDRLKIFAVFGFIFSKQSFIIKPLGLLDYGEFVYRELVVFGAFYIVLRFVYWYVFRDKD